MAWFIPGDGFATQSSSGNIVPGDGFFASAPSVDVIVELDVQILVSSQPALSFEDVINVAAQTASFGNLAITEEFGLDVGVQTFASSNPSVIVRQVLRISATTQILVSSSPDVFVTGSAISLDVITLASFQPEITEEFGLDVGVQIFTSSNPAIVTDIGSVFLSTQILTSSSPQPFTGVPPVGSYFLAYIHQSGGNYNIVYRTSEDFISWSSENVVSIGGLDATMKKYNVSVFQEGAGSIFLFFDVVEATDTVSGVELINIYYTQSDDGGDTWTSATALTAYSTFGLQGTHPYVAQKQAGTMTVVYTETLPSLTMDNSIDGYCGSLDMYVSDMHFDSVTRKLYMVCAITTAVKHLDCIVEVNPDTWEIENCWNCATVPAFNSIFCEKHIWWSKHHGERHYQAIQVMDIASVGTGLRQVALLNAQDDSIRHYVFETNAGYGLTQNVNWTNYASYSLMGSGTWVDFDNNRLYVLMISSYIYQKVIHLGYFDITDDTPNYDFTDVISRVYEYAADDYEEPSEYNIINHLYSPFLIVPEEDYAIISFAHPEGSTGTVYKGRLMIFSLSEENAVIKDYVWHTTGGSGTKSTAFPYHGLTTIAYLNGKIYGGFTYEGNIDGEEDKNGLCCISLATNIINYYVPTEGTHPNGYEITDIQVMDTTRLLISSNYGVYIFDTSDSTWTLYNNTTVPGLTPSEENEFLNIAYDAENEMIFAGSAQHGNQFIGLAMFSEDGYIKRSKYMVGTYTGSWAWSEASNWVQGNRDYDASVSSVDNSYFTFWVNEDMNSAEKSIMWDSEVSSLDLTSYLVKSDDVVVERTIDGTPAKISFALSSGHLFDPHNNNSILRQYTTRFRLLTVRFGEKIEGIDYWVNQGSFIISEVRLSYKRGEYPVMHVVAEDKRILWSEHEITATEFYDDYPEPVLRDLLEEFALLEEEDIDIVDFDDREKIYIQWTETGLKDIIEQIVNRFGYFSRMTVDDIFQTRKISRENDVDHVYEDSTKIVEFTPDDSYSDFTNQVIVAGEERSKTNVTHNEERITSLNGTVGWWGGTEEHKIYYSDDKARRCLTPRMDRLQVTSSVSFEIAEFFGDSIDIYISETDPENRWCIVTVEVPSLLPELLGVLAALGITMWIGDAETQSTTIPVGSALRTFFMIAALQILASVVNYSFEIWANPVGKIRRSIQGEANDTEMQTNLGYVVTKKFDDPLCFTVEGCQSVAEFELMVAQLQRRRIKFTKISHLQDEEGDTIQIPHPYTGQTLTIFVTNLTRRFKKAIGSGTEGYFYDEIEGWVIE